MSSCDFQPFYDRYAEWIAKHTPVPSSLVKVLLSACLGLPFFAANFRFLGVLISCAMLAHYYATHTFRNMLPYMYLRLETRGPEELLKKVNETLTDPQFRRWGVGFGVINSLMGLCFGPPFHSWDLAVAYAGFFVAGFACGMPILGIRGVVVTMNAFGDAHPKLDYTEPDRCGGTAVLGRALVKFTAVTLFVGGLIAWYIWHTPWTHLDQWYLKALRWFWIAWPFLMSSIVLLLPARRIGRSLEDYKVGEAKALRDDLVKLRDEIEDPKLAAAAREESRKNYDLHVKLREKLYQMRTSPYDAIAWLKYGGFVLANGVAAAASVNHVANEQNDLASVLADLRHAWSTFHDLLGL